MTSYMPKKKASYGNENITSLKGADRVRKRPAVIFGSDGLEGCEHSIFEILSNSIDEAREGFGDKIVVTRSIDGSIEVQDFGRGIPMDYNENEGKFNWELVFCELYAGGKYNTNDSDGSYEYSLGLNGLGLCATQYASEYMDAEVHRDGWCYKMHFEHGEPAGKLVKEPYQKKDTGSTIRWRPDLKVFTDINVPLEYYQETILRQSVVNAGVRFVLRDQTEKGFATYEYFYENGISDYVKEFAGEEAFSSVQFWQTERKGRDRADKPDYKVKINAALCFSNKKQRKEYYHNSSFLEHGGAPEKAARSAFVSQIDAYLKQNGKYLKSDSKISFQDVEDCLILVISSFSTQTSYENQTKKAITNKFIQEAMTEFLRHQLEVYFIENRLEADKIAEQVLINMRSRIKAETTRQNLKKTLQSSNDMTNRIKILGCGVEVRSKASKELSSFNLDLLRWNKVIICTDADVDGFQIRTLVLTMIYRLMPTLIDEGKVFIAESPLYEINHKGQTWFAYTEKEKADVLTELGDCRPKPDIQRSKGLGENDADMMSLTTMNPATRRLIKIEPDAAEETSRMFDMLLGNNLAARKTHIADNGHLYLDLTDVS